MEPQFEELAKRITDDVTIRLTLNVERIVDQAKKELQDQAQVTKEELLYHAQATKEELLHHAQATKEELLHHAQATKEDLVRHAQATKEELLHHAQATKEELLHHARVNVEEVTEQAKAVAGNYGAVLDGIHRQLQDLNSKVDVKFRDHDLVLANHHDRITKLEKR
jgi:cell division septum initiation protein DivIVA